MKKTLIALALAVVIPVAAFAATDRPGTDRHGARLDRMAETLQLDESQKERMKALFEEHKAERQAMREQMRAQMGEILNEEQRAKMEAMHEERRERRQEKRAHRHKRDCGEAKSS